MSCFFNEEGEEFSQRDEGTYQKSAKKASRSHS